LETESPKEVPGLGLYEALKEAKKQFVLKAIEQAGGNYAEAGRLLGGHPNHIHRLIRRLNLKAALEKCTEGKRMFSVECYRSPDADESDSQSDATLCGPRQR